MLLKPQSISDIHRNSVPKNHRNNIRVEAGSGGMNNFADNYGCGEIKYYAAWVEAKTSGF